MAQDEGPPPGTGIRAGPPVGKQFNEWRIGLVGKPEGFGMELELGGRREHVGELLGREAVVLGVVVEEHRGALLDGPLP